LTTGKRYINADVDDGYNIPHKSRPFIFANAHVKGMTDYVVLAVQIQQEPGRAQ
jgi:hypothetical protein